MTNIKAKAVYANAFKTKKAKITKIGVKFVGTFKDVPLTLNGVIEANKANVDLYEQLRVSEKEIEFSIDDSSIREDFVNGTSYFSVNVEATELKKIGFEAQTRSESLMADIAKLQK